MSGTWRRLWMQLRLEIDSLYRFPIVEIFVSFILFVTILGLGTMSIELGLEATTGSELDISEIMIQNDQSLEYWGTGLLSNTLSSLTVMLILIIPLFITFIFAAGFEDGSHRTLLSYPVSRNQFLFLRVIVLFLLSVVTVVFSFISVASIMFPVVLELPLTYISMLSISLFIMLMISSSMVIAMVTRKTMITAIGSLGIWYSVLIVLSTEHIPTIIKATLIPTVGILELAGESGVALLDILISFCGSAFISITLLVISAYIFRRVEI